MDNTQLAQMVTWLDEQHRRDRAEIAKLQQRIEAQTNESQEQARRLQELEAQLTTTQMKLSQFSQLEQALQNLRNEITLLVNAQKDEIAKLQRDAERARMNDREVQARELANVRKELSRIQALEEALAVRKAEDQRLGEITLGLRQEVTELSQTIDQRTRNLPYILEQHDYDKKRISQMQQENVALFKRVEEATSKLEMLEQKLQRTESQIKAIAPTIEDMQRGQAQFIESLKLADADRQRQMREWQEAFVAQQEAMQQQQQRIQEFTITHEKTNQAIASLEQFRERLLNEQKQVAELQRLAEERQRKELESFVADNEKRWKKQLLEWKFHWSQQEKLNRMLQTALPRLEQQISTNHELLTLLWQTIQAQSQNQLDAGQTWLQALQKVADQRESLVKNYEELKQTG
ncbi:MAG: hypothetical protein GXP38_12400 [Chloroflexi bacterium]|nr:hypothetical protein [Chloroflexota bacterium]